MKKYTTKELVLKALKKQPMKIQELVVKTRATRSGVEKALKTLVEGGLVTRSEDPHHGGQGRATVTYQYVDDDEEIDWTPNRKYNGPSYTHFLQGIWNEPRDQAS